MAIKLIKACKELNIGMATLTAWCEKNGHPIESDPNVRIDDDLYLLLAKEFNKDMATKIEADRQAAERAAKEEAAKAAAEAEARAKAEAEAARLAAEEAARAEAERLAAEQAEAERLAAEKAEAERLAAEKAAAEALAALTLEENIYFDLDKTVLRECEQPKVDRIIAFLKEHPESKVSISGYADKETGNHKHNMDLSQKRAARISKALQDAGIAADRISTAYYGDTVRVAPTPEENRVSVCVIK